MGSVGGAVAMCLGGGGGVSGVVVGCVAMIDVMLLVAVASDSARRMRAADCRRRCVEGLLARR